MIKCGCSNLMAVYSRCVAVAGVKTAYIFTKKMEVKINIDTSIFTVTLSTAWRHKAERPKRRGNIIEIVTLHVSCPCAIVSCRRTTTVCARVRTGTHAHAHATHAHAPHRAHRPGWFQPTGARTLIDRPLPFAPYKHPGKLRCIPSRSAVGTL